jgi:XapX domain-containing protein
MVKIIAGLVLGFLIGLGCRFFDVQVPSPPKLVGALLVVAMTLDYLATDAFLARNLHVFGERQATTVKCCGDQQGRRLCNATRGTNRRLRVLNKAGSRA